MVPYFVSGRANLLANANANSLHGPGRQAFAAMEAARKSLSASIGAQRPAEIIFTSGATEADNAAIFGMAQGAYASAKKRGLAKDGFVPHIITSAIEHEAVLEPVRRLEREGFAVTRLTPNRQGVITVESLEAALTPSTLLVSIQAANSEIGSVMPVKELARAAHRVGALFHTDATQALGKVPLSVREWDVDAASFSAHKVCGPKGVGCLYLKARTPFEATMLGGGQESGRRSSTQNVAGMVGFAAAAQAAVGQVDAESARLRGLRDSLFAALDDVPGVIRTVDVMAGSADYLPNIVHVMVRGWESETLIIRLDHLGFGVSGGSACASRSLDPSHVLTAMGVQSDLALGALRISLGRYTTAEDVELFVRALRSVIG